MTDLWVAQDRLGAGGSDDSGRPVLVLLHGLGHTAHVWDRFTELVDGPWIAPDLSGHGRSRWAKRYSFGNFAADVANAVADTLDGAIPPERPLVVVGHSMGGVVALALTAGTFGIPVRAAVGFGIKVSWTGDELSAMRARAARPPRVFASEAEARAAFVRFAGLEGIDGAGPESALAGSGVQAAEGGYRLATDPRTMLVGAPPMAAMLAGAAVPVVLAAGEHDHMVTREQLEALDERAEILPDLGHNLHVTHPERLLALVERVGAAG